MADISNGRRNMLAWITFLAVLLSVACGDAPIRIGFSGPLKGKYSDLGVQGRNGALLAVEDINAAGGIQGRRLELLARDDGSTPEDAVQADQELRRAGVSVIIGHMTSAQTMAALDGTRDSGLLYISPTTSTNLLQGIRDNFFRVIPSLTNMAEGQALHVLHMVSGRRVALIWDRANAPFAEPYKKAFARTFAQQGGQIMGEVAFDTHRDPPDWEHIVAELKPLRPDIVLTITSARDLATFAQYSKLGNSSWTILSSMWAYTKELVQTGGKSVEGVIFAVYFVEDDPTPQYARFSEKFRNRFGWEPNFAAAFAYEAVQVCAAAIKKNDGDTKNLDAVLPGMTLDQGVVGPFSLDDHGDVRRVVSVVTVRNGKFITLNATK